MPSRWVNHAATPCTQKRQGSHAMFIIYRVCSDISETSQTDVNPEREDGSMQRECLIGLLVTCAVADITALRLVNGVPKTVLRRPCNRCHQPSRMPRDPMSVLWSCHRFPNDRFKMLSSRRNQRGLWEDAGHQQWSGS